MARAHNRLNQLQRQLDESETSIADASRRLTTAQNTVKRLTSHRTLIENVRNEIGASRAVVDAQRRTIVKDLAGTEKAVRELNKRLNDETSRAQRQAIETSIRAVDAEIDKLRREVATLIGRHAAAERAAAKAREVATTRADRYRQAQEQLRRLPGDASTMQARIVQLLAAAKVAADSGKLDEAVALMVDLRSSLAGVRQLAEAVLAEHQARDRVRLVAG